MSRRKGQNGYVREMGSKWQGVYRVDNAHTRDRQTVILGEISAMTKSEARAALREYIQKLGVNTVDHLNRALQPVVLFKTRATAWLDSMKGEAGMYGRLKPSTFATLSSHLNSRLLPRFEKTSVTNIGEAEVDALISDMAAKRLAKSTIKSTLLVLGMVLGRKIDARTKLRALKFLQPKKSRDTLWFTKDEMQKIIAAARGRYRVLFATAAATGCRAGELYALQIEDVDFDRGFIHVRRSAWEAMVQSPKTENAYRTIGIDSALIDMLCAWIGDRTAGFLFPSETNKPLRHTVVLKFGLHPVLKNLGITRRGMHAFRHGRVSMLVEAGVPINTIKAWIGHGSEKMVEQYTHFRPEYHAESLALVPSVVLGIDANDAKKSGKKIAVSSAA